MTTLRLLDLYCIPFYKDIIKIIQNNEIKESVEYLQNYYKKRKSNKEEYLLAYN